MSSTSDDVYGRHKFKPELRRAVSITAAEPKARGRPSRSTATAVGSATRRSPREHDVSVPGSTETDIGASGQLKSALVLPYAVDAHRRVRNRLHPFEADLAETAEANSEGAGFDPFQRGLDFLQRAFAPSGHCHANIVAIGSIAIDKPSEMELTSLFKTVGHFNQLCRR